MSTTVKTGWLHDKNGDKFAPKTLTSQVQTSDGILIENKIQADLDAVKQEILDTIDPNTIMNYLGEVNELPQTANEGDVCTFNTNKKLDLVANGLSELDNQLIVLGYTGPILSFATSAGEKIQVLDAMAEFITGSTSLQDVSYSEPKTIKIQVQNDIFTLKVSRFSYYVNSGASGIDLYGTIDPNVEYYFFNSTSKVVISMGEDNPILMIYRNGQWERLVPETTDSGLKNLLDGEPEGSLQTQNAQVLGENSIALGENAIAGCMAYYIKSIDLTNKKIYLSTTQTVPTISTDDNTDQIFVTPGYVVGNKFSIDSGNYYGYCGTITNISYNVISYSEDSLGFDSIVAVDGDLEIDDYTLHVPTQPEVGIVNIVENAVAIGIDNKATGKNAFAEGGENIADGGYAHVEGRQNYASYASHAEGRHNIASGVCAHAEGYWTTAIGVSAHVEGQENKGIGQAIHVEGMKNEGYGEYSHVEGYLNKLTVEGKWGHVEGYDNEVSAEKAHAEGTNTTASGIASHAEGTATKASAANAHAEGVATQATGEASHAEGNNTVASKAGAHAEGQSSKAQGDQSHAEGFNTEATAQGAHAEGRYSKAKSEGAHAEGHDTQATGQYSHAEGYGSKATTSGTHAEGWASEASGFSAHAEGHGSIASGGRAHAEGYSTTAKGENGSHAEGHGTIAAGVSQHVQGKYNVEDSSKAHIVGWGSSTDNRKNIHTLDTTGNAWFAGNITVGSGNKILATEEFVNNKFNDMGSLAGESSGFKTIGFTDNCDYIATPTDGRTAFVQAIEDANDGDTILVMAGEYLGSSQLDITKDLNFVALGLVIIKFNVWTQGGGSFSFENWEWETVYDSKHSKWLGFTFDGNFLVGVYADPDNMYYNGFTTAKNCRFNGGMNALVGNFENCTFESTGFEVGHYYGADKSTFNNCIFKVTSFVDNVGTTTYNKCELYYMNEINVTTWVENDGFIDCKFYAPGSTISVNDSHGGNPLYLNNSFIYANGLVQSWDKTGIVGGFLISCVPLGSDSTANYVTRTEMENYVNEQILGGQW